MVDFRQFMVVEVFQAKALLFAQQPVQIEKFLTSRSFKVIAC